MVFEHYIQSLFIISSPLQLLCVVEAIKEFEIGEYSLIYLSSVSDPRSGQIMNMMEYLGLKGKIEVVDLTPKEYMFGYKREECETNTTYPRVFIGDIFSENQICLALAYARRGSVIIAMDDGNSTIVVIDNKIRREISKRLVVRTFLKLKAKVQGVSIDKYFFSVYSNIKTNKIIWPNRMTYFENINYKKKKAVYFIGTNSKALCPYLGIEYTYYLKKLQEILTQLANDNKDCELIYVPHGRDSSIETKEICRKVGFAYTSLNEAVELYLVRNNLCPAVVAGFTSSALYNLSIIFKGSCKISNYLFEGVGNSFSAMEAVSNVYENNGIYNVKI